MGIDKNSTFDGNEIIVDVVTFTPYSATNKLRYKAKEIDSGNGTAKKEYRLQQMWQGSEGYQTWQWIDYVD